MLELQRLTVLFDELEDRLRLAGEDGEGRTVLMWMTKRLLVKLLPAMVSWIETRSDGRSEHQTLMSFEQEVARAALVTQAVLPVQAPADGGWLIHAVDVSNSADIMRLLFRGAKEGEQASFTLEIVALRQWLSILHDQCRQADWAIGIWPEWIEPSLRSPDPKSAWIN